MQHRRQRNILPRIIQHRQQAVHHLNLRQAEKIVKAIRHAGNFLRPQNLAKYGGPTPHGSQQNHHIAQRAALRLLLPNFGRQQISLHLSRLHFLQQIVLQLCRLRFLRPTGQIICRIDIIVLI